MNYVGFEEMRGQGAPELLYNQIFIEPNMPEATGTGNIAAAGYVPGQQHYLKPRTQVYNKSDQVADKRLARQGFKRVYGSYY